MNEFVTEVNPVVIAFAGLVIPMITAVINSVRWTSEVKSLVSLMVGLGVGAGLGYLMGMRSTEAILTCAVGTYMAAQVGYAGVIRPTGIGDSLEQGVAPRDGPVIG